MEPKYSVLLCNQSINEYSDKITRWLADGIKVIWFGREEDVSRLKKSHRSFEKVYLFQAYVTSLFDAGIIIDGEGDNKLFNNLAADCKLFNSAQYEVEHSHYDDHIVVTASAGTGKTTVMIDRIMYLLHTIPDLRLSDVYMITFTNDAAKQMNTRLQDALMGRYQLTKKKKYLRWVEEQSQMHISTIHSFAYYMLKQIGINESFTKRLSIRSFEFEKKELIKDAIDEKIDDKKSVKNQMGVPFYRANTIVYDYWNKFMQLGVSHEDMIEMDWGEPVDDISKDFHTLIQNIILTLDERFFDIKRQNNAISVNDIIRDLHEILLKGNLPETDINMRYLFIDEFQDSDLSQIKVACTLSKIFGTLLFVVGDIKQSIYRFRGANEKSFQIFYNDMEAFGLKKPVEYTLINNYRTAAGVLNRMDDYFFAWAKQGILKYDKKAVPFKSDSGSIKMIPSKEKETDPEQLSKIVSDELNKLIEKIDNSSEDSNEKNRVVLLTRSNKELSEIAYILNKAKIPVSVRRDGSFFASEAVRDFYMMVSSFMFCDEPKYVFNYLLTPYAGEIDPLDLNMMEKLVGNKEDLESYIDHFLNQTSWKKYHKDLRLRPVMSVFKEMLDNESIIDNYILANKARRTEEGWEPNRINADTTSRAAQYQANLEKLIELLQNNLSGDKVSLYDVYNYLKINVATNRTEGEASVQTKDDYHTALCMTVHKSKGLEFDTVIIPFTNESFGGYAKTELLVDPVEKKVGWYYTGDKEKVKRRYKYSPMKNSYYNAIQSEERQSDRLEGVRVLYVGMTRAINTLICIVEESRNKMSWARLIEDVGVDYE